MKRLSDNAHILLSCQVLTFATARDCFEGLRSLHDGKKTLHSGLGVGCWWFSKHKTSPSMKKQTRIKSAFCVCVRTFHQIPCQLKNLHSQAKLRNLRFFAGNCGNAPLCAICGENRGRTGEGPRTGGEPGEGPRTGENRGGSRKNRGRTGGF